MRPTKLTMQAFGPYAKTEIIDFTEIGSEQIFVISGKTGAGKTTIFDAMSFALYGKANTNARDGLSLRSHFATADTMTEVELIFSINKQNYRITRSPQQEIQKRNSTETRVINAKAALYKLAEQEQLLASNVREVDEKIAEILQLDVNQFRQILMIPQNEFRELLLSPSKEKQLILQKLANTLIYKKVEEQLRDAQKEQLTKIHTVEEQLERTKLALQTSFSEAEQAEHFTTTEKISRFVELKLEEQATFMKTVESELTILGIRIENATKDVAFAETKLKTWAKLDTALAEKDALQTQYKTMTDKRNRLELNKRTATLKLQETKCQQLEKQEQTYKNELQTLLQKLEVAKAELAEVKEERNIFLEQQAEQNEYQKDLSNFDLYETKITQIEQAEQTIVALRAELSDFETNYRTNNEQIVDFEAKKQTYQDTERALNEAKLVKKDVEIAITLSEQELKTLQMQITAKSQQDKLLDEQTAIKTKLAGKEAEVAQLTIQFSVLEKQKQSSHAFMLADNLVEGEPCPVCGATHHPNLMLEAEAFDSAQFEQLEQQLAELKASEQSLLAELARYDGMLSQLAENDTNTLVALQEKKEELETKVKYKLEHLQMLNKELLAENQNTNNLVWTVKELNTLYQNREALQLDIAKWKEEIGRISAQTEMLQKQIPKAYLDRNYFYEKQKELQEIVGTYQAQAQKLDETFGQKRDLVSQYETEHNLTIRNLQKLEEELQEEQSLFEKAILQADFADYLAYSKAVLTADEEKAITEEVQAFEQTFYHNQQVVEELRKQLDGEDKPNIAELQAKFDQYTSDRVAVLEKKAKYHEQLQNLATQFAMYQETNTELTAQEALYRDLGEIADVANGKNERNIGFERYVLGTFLDNILLHTNERLAKMTNGRFTLLRKNEKAKFNAQSGLDLVVFDEYTGKNRDVTSLSGGESFKTSLALALALAEVVQEMSGGISLETMFIDEGFGTLDADSLDAAVETLLETEQSGRLVGIISHVPELKERIPVKLEVTATSEGSHTKFIKS